MATTTSDTTVARHPIRGAVWGILFGIGLALLLAGRKVIAFGETSSFLIVIAIGIVLGALWGQFGPARAPKGPQPVAVVEPDDPLAASADDDGDGSDDGPDDDPARVDIG